MHHVSFYSLLKTYIIIEIHKYYLKNGIFYLLQLLPNEHFNKQLVFNNIPHMWNIIFHISINKMWLSLGDRKRPLENE